MIWTPGRFQNVALYPKEKTMPTHPDLFPYPTALGSALQLLLDPAAAKNCKIHAAEHVVAYATGRLFPDVDNPPVAATLAGADPKTGESECKKVAAGADLEGINWLSVLKFALTALLSMLG